MMLIHRRVVRVGAAAAWITAAIFVLAGFFARNDSLFLEAIGPVLAASFMTALIALNREHGGIALLGSAAVVMVMYWAIGDEATLLPAALALIIISSIGMLFVTAKQVPVTVGVAIVLAFVPRLWAIDREQALMLGSLMGLSFVMTTVILVTLRNAATAINVKFKVLFEQSPTAVQEEDWTAAMAYVRAEYSGMPERLRQFLLAHPEVVQKAIGKAEIARVNQAAVDLLEASGPEELLGPRNPEGINPESLETFIDGIVALYEGRGFYESEFPAQTFKGREIWLQARCVESTAGAHPDSVLVALADVTHARAKEEAMEESIRAKDSFIAAISHELRTPLTAVVGLTSEMVAGSVEADEMLELMQIVSNQAQEMSYIVDDLLVAARAEMGAIAFELRPFDLGAQVGEAIEGTGILLTETPGDIPDVYVDAGRVRQILRNLLTNLDRYGGEERRVLGGQADGMAWIEVRDNGVGVPAEDAERIFEPYETAHTSVAASVGLGLSVARQLAELMGGSLSYRREGDETVFRLELPLAGATAAV